MEPISLRVPNVGIINILEELHRVPFNVITHACAREPRFGGWTLADWSVAQHSMLVGAITEYLGGNVGDFVAGLCHDLPEGCGLKDIPSPVKRRLQPNYRELEDRVLTQLEHLIGFDLSVSCDIVKRADTLALHVEQRLLQNADVLVEEELVGIGALLLADTYGMDLADLGGTFADTIRTFASGGDKDWLGPVGK